MKSLFEIKTGIINIDASAVSALKRELAEFVCYVNGLSELFVSDVCVCLSVSA